ncbi:hypothetical protein PI124_g17563 [Phytophthora idaei]|nr:hypothetical protein PI125_g18072 [Phytophthora idaei]KAG3138673.1 hypothetical protein PI126_g16814 [Phytophthora idaei]KAG3237455.1 hypothetical protein PI124_g17563 [Phytophthora idaei]
MTSHIFTTLQADPDVVSVKTVGARTETGQDVVFIKTIAAGQSDDAACETTSVAESRPTKAAAEEAEPEAAESTGSEAAYEGAYEPPPPRDELAFTNREIQLFCKYCHSTRGREPTFAEMQAIWKVVGKKAL